MVYEVEEGSLLDWELLFSMFAVGWKEWCLAIDILDDESAL